ncbi:MAG: hypothetical protein ABJA83_09330 [Burkholderiaceae bacterium]
MMIEYDDAVARQRELARLEASKLALTPKPMATRGFTRWPMST